MNDKTFENYIWDLNFLLKENALNAKAKKNASKPEDLDYNLGYLMAYHEVIDLMKQQASAFNIKQRDIGLADINADVDLL